MIGLSLSDNIDDNPIRIRPHIVFTDGRQQRQPIDNMTTYYEWVVVVVVRQLTQYVVILSMGCRCCRSSVNTICGRHILCLLTNDDNDNPIIIRPHIVFTDGRQ
jgi:hypothetical protein